VPQGLLDEGQVDVSRFKSPSFTHRVQVDNKLAASGKMPDLLYLEILVRITNANAIVLRKSFE
jgi:hypothetical protein